MMRKVFGSRALTSAMLGNAMRFEASAPKAAVDASVTPPPGSQSALAPRKLRSDYSELAGSVDVPLLNQLTGYYINVQSRKLYFKDALRMEHQAVKWAYSDIRKNAEALAHGLLQSGLRPGQRILSIQPTNCENLVIQMACAKIGVLLCQIPHEEVTADKLRYYLNLFQPQQFILREWIVVPEKRGDELIERNSHFWDTVYNVIPELGLAYPGQKFQWTFSQEFFFLKKCVITDHNMNLIGCGPMRRWLCWGPFSYYEQRLRRFSRLLHPDDPLLALEDASAVAEDKQHVVFTQRNLLNAGYIFGKMMKLKPETRWGVLPNHHHNPIGAIIAPYAGLTSGSVLCVLHDNLFTDDHAINVIEKQCVEELRGILGKKKDFDLLLKHAGNFDADQYEMLQWVCLFEDVSEPVASNDYLKQIKSAFGLDDVYVFRGPIESCHMLQWRSLSKGDLGMVPHAEAAVVGDRGTTDAKVLARGKRGNLRLRGPHVANNYFNNAGLLTELVDDNGYVATSRDGIIDKNGNVEYMAPQTY